MSTKARLRKREKAEAIRVMLASQLSHCGLMRYSWGPDSERVAGAVEKVLRLHAGRIGGRRDAVARAQRATVDPTLRDALLAAWMGQLGCCRAAQYAPEPAWALAAVEIEKIIRVEIERLGSAVPATATAWIHSYRRMNRLRPIARRNLVPETEV